MRFSPGPLTPCRTPGVGFDVDAPDPYAGMSSDLLSGHPPLDIPDFQPASGSFMNDINAEDSEAVTGAMDAASTPKKRLTLHVNTAGRFPWMALAALPCLSASWQHSVITREARSPKDVEDDMPLAAKTAIYAHNALLKAFRSFRIVETLHTGTAHLLNDKEKLMFLSADSTEDDVFSGNVFQPPFSLCFIVRN